MYGVIMRCALTAIFHPGKTLRYTLLYACAMAQNNYPGITWLMCFERWTLLFPDCTDLLVSGLNAGKLCCRSYRRNVRINNVIRIKFPEWMQCTSNNVFNQRLRYACNRWNLEIAGPSHRQRIWDKRTYVTSDRR